MVMPCKCSLPIHLSGNKSRRVPRVLGFEMEGWANWSVPVKGLGSAARPPHKHSGASSCPQPLKEQSEPPSSGRATLAPVGGVEWEALSLSEEAKSLDWSNGGLRAQATLAFDGKDGDFLTREWTWQKPGQSRMWA